MEKVENIRLHGVFLGFLFLTLIGCRTTQEVELSMLRDESGIAFLPFQAKPFTGIAVKNYPDGSKLESFTYKKGRKHGRHISWFRDGNRQYEGSYKNGIEHGKWIRWHENGEKSGAGEFKFGNENGKWIIWHEGGGKMVEYLYKNGALVSEKYWGPDGNRLNGKKTEDETPHQNSHSNAVEHSKVRIGDDGLWYYLGKPFSGTTIKYYPNGTKYGVASLKNGRWDGPMTKWFENGQREWHGFHREGKRDGLWTEWKSDGQKWSEGSYKDGLKEGPWTIWHSNGKKSSEGQFSAGRLISTKNWDRFGNPQ